MHTQSSQLYRQRMIPEHGRAQFGATAAVLIYLAQRYGYERQHRHVKRLVQIMTGRTNDV